MFGPKKMIPKLTVAALALSGCGGDGGANGDFDASLSAFCMNVDAPCWGYSVEYCTAYYNAVNAYNADAQCTAALISYFNCGATKTCDEIFAGACYDEYDAAWDDACYELP